MQPKHIVVDNKLTTHHNISTHYHTWGVFHKTGLVS